MYRSPRSLTFYCTHVMHKPLNKQQTEAVPLKSSEEKRGEQQERTSRSQFSYMEETENWSICCVSSVDCVQIKYLTKRRQGPLKAFFVYCTTHSYNQQNILNKQDAFLPILIYTLPFPTNSHPLLPHQTENMWKVTSRY